MCFSMLSGHSLLGKSFVLISLTKSILHSISIIVTSSAILDLINVYFDSSMTIIY